MKLPAALVALGMVTAASSVGCGISPKMAAAVDADIADMATAAKIGISLSDEAAIDSAVEKGDKAEVRRLIRRGVRTPAEIARIESDKLKLQIRWKEAR